MTGLPPGVPPAGGPTAHSEAIGVGEGADQRQISVAGRSGRSPGIFWLGGFMATMDGTKAVALDAHAEATGRAMVRFDYSGHGASSGAFRDGTITRWLEEAIAVFNAETAGLQIVVGSSMGGWLALLLADHMKKSGAASRVAGLVLIAPAIDMTSELIEPRLTKAARRELGQTGETRVRSDSAEPLLITRRLLEDGRAHLYGDRLIEPECPVHILQGSADTDVPWRHAARLISRMPRDDAVFTLIKDGDHRLSRPEDIQRIIAAVEGLIAEVSAS